MRIAERLGQSYAESKAFKPASEGLEEAYSVVAAGTTAPLELTFRFPKVKGALVSRLSISIGDDRVIEARVMEKERAEEKYDDAVAAGHGAVKMTETKGESYELSLGNVQPGQEAVVKIQL